MTGRGPLGRPYTDSGAVAINDRGQVVGTSFTAKVTQTGQHGHAFVWQEGKMTDLGTLGRTYGDSSAAALNGRGEVAGSSFTGGGKRQPVLWRHGRITDLRAPRGGLSETVP